MLAELNEVNEEKKGNITSVTPTAAILSLNKSHLSNRFLDLVVCYKQSFWWNKSLKRINPNFVRLLASETTFLFRQSVSEILYVLDTNPNVLWSNMPHIPILLIIYLFNVFFNSSGKILYPLFELLNPVTAIPRHI